MSQEKNDPYIPSSSNPDPSAPLEPPSYADSVAIAIESGQQPLNAEYLKGLSYSNPLPPYQSNPGLYDRTELYDEPFSLEYDDSLSEEPAIIQGQPIEQDFYSQEAPVVGPIFITITRTCQECAQRREAKRIRQLSRERGGRNTFCCHCPHTHDGGSDYGFGLFAIICLLVCCPRTFMAPLVCGLIAIICFLVCCFRMLVAPLIYACCPEEEEPEERCSTCGNII